MGMGSLGGHAEETSLPRHSGACDIQPYLIWRYSGWCCRATDNFVVMGVGGSGMETRRCCSGHDADGITVLLRVRPFIVQNLSLSQ